MVKDLRAALAGWIRNTTGRRKTYDAPAQPRLVEPGARFLNSVPCPPSSVPAVTAGAGGAAPPAGPSRRADTAGAVRCAPMDPETT